MNDIQAPPDDALAIGSADSTTEVLADSEQGIKTQIAEFIEACELTTALKKSYKQIAADRKLLAEDIDENDDDPFRVETNWLFNKQEVALAQLFPSRPQVQMEPMNMLSTDSMKNQMIERFADTLEMVCQRKFDQADGAAAAQASAQDAMTDGLNWLRCVWTEDPSRDALGWRAVSDEKDQIMHMNALMRQYDDGTITEDSAEYQEILDLGRYFVQQAKAEMDLQHAMQTGVDPRDERARLMADLAEHDPDQPLPVAMRPEVETWKGPMIDSWSVEHVFIDKNIRDIKYWRRSSHVTLLHLMTADEAIDQFPLTQEDVEKHLRFTKKLKDDEDYDSTEPVEIPVYERYDGVTYHRYVFIEGMEKFLVREVPPITWRNFYPITPVYYHRATKTLLPISDVKLQKGLQKELNELAADDRDARDAAGDRLITKKGAMTENDKTAWAEGSEKDVIEVEGFNDIKENLMYVKGPVYDPRRFTIGRERAIQDLDRVSGMPSQASGATGQADFAAEVAVANQQMQVQSSRATTRLNEALTDIFTMISDYAVQSLTTLEVQQLCGDNAFWPILTKRDLVNRMTITVTAAGAMKPGVMQHARALESVASTVERLNNIAVVPYFVDIPVIIEPLLAEIGGKTSLRRALVPLPEAMQRRVQAEQEAATHMPQRPPIPGANTEPAPSAAPGMTNEPQRESTEPAAPMPTNPE